MTGNAGRGRLGRKQAWPLVEYLAGSPAHRLANDGFGSTPMRRAKVYDTKCR